jgi:Sulfotransferase family
VTDAHMTGARERRPILVTGSHRSGSTWTGRMIGASDEVGYVHEPFNINRGPGILRTQFPYWFMYIRPGTDGQVADDFRRLLAFRYNFGAQILSTRSSDDVRALLRDGSQFLRFRRRNARPLLKDPMAIFSAEWIAETFDAHVLVVARHPAAFASSLKRLGWTHPFSHFLSQPALMQDHLEPFEPEIAAFAREEHDILDQAALLWRLVHHAIAGYKSRHPDWLFARHEDLSREPIEGFRTLYGAMGLPFTDGVQEEIRRSTSSSNPGERDVKDQQTLVRDSRANVDNWRRRLTPAEIERIRTQVADVSGVFYGDDEW